MTLRTEVVPERPLVRTLFRFAQGVAVLAVAVIAAAGAAHVAPVAGVAYAASLALGGGAFVASYWLRRKKPDWSGAVSVTADAEGLSLPGASPVRASEILSAMVTPKKSGIEVELKLRGLSGWPIRFFTRTVEEARAIVDALGLGAGKRALTRKVMSPVIDPRNSMRIVLAMFAGVVLGAVLATNVAPAFGVLAASFPLGFVAFYTLGLVKTKITIGADGVTTRWMGRTRSIALGDIARVDVVVRGSFTPKVVRLGLRDGTSFDLAIGLRGSNLFEPFVVAEECELVAERIREAMALGVRAAPTEFRMWADHRAELPIAKWIEALRSTVASYREDGAMPFSLADLWVLLENVQAHPAERAAAAIAMSAKLDALGKARLRSVAEATAIPKLRVAIESVAAGDDAELTAALEQLREDQRLRGEQPVQVRVQDYEGEALAAEALAREAAEREDAEREERALQARASLE